LGPEETGASALRSGTCGASDCGQGRGFPGWVARAWFRLLLENCIVDASIFCNLRYLRLYVYT
jgi:hypothetical protein